MLWQSTERSSNASSQPSTTLSTAAAAAATGPAAQPPAHVPGHGRHHGRWLRCAHAAVWLLLRQLNDWRELPRNLCVLRKSTAALTGARVATASVP